MKKNCFMANNKVKISNLWGPFDGLWQINLAILIFYFIFAV